MNIDWKVVKDVVVIAFGTLGISKLLADIFLERKKLINSKDLARFSADLTQIFQSELEKIKLENSKELGEFQRHLDHKLKEQEGLIDAKRKFQVEANSKIFDKELAVYPETLEAIYRCKNSARDCSSPNKLSKSAVSELSQNVYLVVEILYKCRIFFSEDVFRMLHRFKIEAQELSILVNQVTRSTEVEDAPVNPKVKEIAEQEIPLYYQRINLLYEQLDHEIRQALKHKIHIN